LHKAGIISIDIAPNDQRPVHPRIEYILGSSVDENVVRKVTEMVGENHKVMVLLDSDHSKNHVLNELRIYSKFVKDGGYVVVEDTNINGHPVYPGFGEGPHEAVTEFLNENPSFEVDKAREKFYLTFNPDGYLKREQHDIDNVRR
jgi:cephalosporin hydroxylase